MLYVEMVLLAIGLAMDSLAVSVTGGALAQQRCGFYKVFKVASVMALFQAGMTLIGFSRVRDLNVILRHSIIGWLSRSCFILEVR